MVEPNIVFCPFNHIYDAALHSKCPYCKKIQENQFVINKSLNLDEDIDSVSEQADDPEYEETEYIIHDDDPEEDATELLRKEEEENQNEFC